MKADPFSTKGGKGYLCSARFHWHRVDGNAGVVHVRSGGHRNRHRHQLLASDPARICRNGLRVRRCAVCHPHRQVDQSWTLIQHRAGKLFSIELPLFFWAESQSTMTQFYDWLIAFWGDYISSVEPVPDYIIEALNWSAFAMMCLVILFPLIVLIAVFSVVRSIRSGGGRFDD